MSDTCKCRGMRWVCEAHPTEPMDHNGCRAPGVPCICNQPGPDTPPLMPPGVTVFVDESGDKRH